VPFTVAPAGSFTGVPDLTYNVVFACMTTELSGVAEAFIMQHGASASHHRRGYNEDLVCMGMLW
jgi:hypothetical protein